MNLWSFTHSKLEDAMDGFKDELGRGAFSTVHKGVLKSDHGGPLDVKRWEGIVDKYDREFKDEVNVIGELTKKKTTNPKIASRQVLILRDPEC